MKKRAHPGSLEDGFAFALGEDVDPSSIESPLSAHREALRCEYGDAQARGLLRCARGLSTFEVATVGAPASRSTVHELLRVWEPEAVPRDSVLGRLPTRVQRMLFREVASSMLHDRCFEIGAPDLGRLAGQVLWRSEDGARLRLNIVARVRKPPRLTRRRAAEDGLALVEEIRRRPGLLVERRPGWFAFADFALQQVLAAVHATWVGRGEPWDLVDLRNDRLWAGVIELAAGLKLPGWDNVGMVRALVEADRSAPPVPTLLAAQCVQAVPDLPAPLRRTVERRLADLVPPRTILEIPRLVEAGDVAAPPLLAALGQARPAERALIAMVLGALRYEPACGVLVAMASDAARVGERASTPVYGEWPVVLGYDVEARREPVAAFALGALFELARATRAGRRAFGRALSRAPTDALAVLRLGIERFWADVETGERDPEPDAGLLSELTFQVASAVARPRK